MVEMNVEIHDWASGSGGGKEEKKIRHPSSQKAPD